MTACQAATVAAEGSLDGHTVASNGGTAGSPEHRVTL